jgi:hypothetical protein
MADSDTQWPDDYHRLTSNDYLLAFGQVALVYNLLEGAMRDIFIIIAPLPREFAEDFAHRLNNRDLIDLLSALIQKNETDVTVREALEHCLACYDTCTENRNILLHVEVDVRAESMFHKRASKNARRRVKFEVSVKDMREIAEQMGHTFSYAMSLDSFLSARRAQRFNSLSTRSGIAAPIPRALSTLPEKPPKPRKLTPYQPPEDRKDDPPPPRSSGA